MRRLRRILVRGVLGLVVVLAVAWVAVAWWGRSLEARLARELEAVDIGPPTSVSAPLDDDALPFLREGTARAEEHPPPGALIMKEYEDFDDADWDAVAAWLELHAPARAAFAEAARRTSCTWTYDANEPPIKWVLEPLRAVQEARWLLDAEAHALLRNGAPAADVLAIADRMVALRRALDDRLLLGWVFRRAMESYALLLARDVATARASALDQVREWVAARRSEDGIRPVTDVLRHERACGQVSISPRFGGLAGIMDRLREAWDPIFDEYGVAEELGLSRPDYGLVVPTLCRSPAGPALTARAALAWLDADTRMIRACEEVLDERTLPALRPLAETERLWFDPFGPPSRSAAPGLVASLLARRARFAVTEAGLDALAWRREHDAWPAAVGDHRDPFTGEPLVYEPAAEGGIRISARAPATFDDIAWRIPAR